MRERESDQEANIQQKVQRRVEWKRLYVIEDLQIILRGCEKRRTLRLNLMVVVSGVRACVSSKTVVTENRNDDDANVFFDVVPALFAQEPLLQRMFAIPYKLVSSKYWEDEEILPGTDNKKWTRSKRHSKLFALSLCPLIQCLQEVS
jgi:hypothetical protein